MRTLKLILAYDGTNYHGWQAQPNRPTIQGALEAALHRVTGERVRVRGAGRTDAGVHALGQVAALETGSRLACDVLRRALGARLPDDVAVLDVAEAPDGFHPSRDARSKRYRYVIRDHPARDVFSRRYCWHYVRGRLDAEAMQRAGQGLLGTHDFASFQTAGSPRESTVRTLFDLVVRRAAEVAPLGPLWSAWLQGPPAVEQIATVAPGGPTAAEAAARPEGRAGEGGAAQNSAGRRPAESIETESKRAGQGGAVDPQPDGGATYGDLVVVEVEADGFLYNMVRAIVGTLVEVGRCARAETWPAEALRAACRSAAGPNAPPQGLFLVRVEYGCEAASGG
jgi:tRNA pseudouridine38-40 synthase